jgi:DNA-binding response OmpR family regulator
MSKQQVILVVDDDPDVRLALQVRLGVNGYVVIFAANGVTAVAEAIKYTPDIIILDLGMSDGDGYMVLEQLRASLIPIIVVTCKDPAGNRPRSLEAGASAYLQKPVDNALLLTTIRQVLAKE